MRDADQAEMNTSDKLIQFIAIGVALVGIGLLVGFVFLLWFQGYRMDPNLPVNMERTGQFGDYIGGLSGSLFALAATLLFYLALTLQRREFRNSLVELRLSSKALTATEEHHRETLKLLREEKQFNVCLTAIDNFRADWNRMIDGEDRGTSNWSRLSNDLLMHYTTGAFFGAQRYYKYYVRDKQRGSVPLDHWNLIKDHIERIEWITESIHSIDLKDEDRKYLAQISRSLVEGINRRFVPQCIRAENQIEGLLATENEKLKKYGVNMMALHDTLDQLKALRLSLQRSFTRLNTF